MGLTKSCLRKVLGKAFVSLAELQTAVSEVECILNDPALIYVSTDSVDGEPFTSSHLLYGRTITSSTYPDERPKEAGTNVTRDTFNKCSQRVQQITQHFGSDDGYKRRDGHNI